MRSVMFCVVRIICMYWYVLKSGRGGGVVNIWLKKNKNCKFEMKGFFLMERYLLV